MNGKVVAIFTSSIARGAMQSQNIVEAVKGKGLKGDRYFRGGGSYNKGRQGFRQVTLIDAAAFANSGFSFSESRRNIVTEGVDLLSLIGKEFQIGGVRMKGIENCPPCHIPSRLSGKDVSFKDMFDGRGGLIAEVLSNDTVRVGNPVILPR